MAGAALVVCGAALVAGGGTTGAASVSVSFSSLFVISMLFPAISSTLKERIFIVAREKFVDHDLDVFVVNTCSSIAQVRPALSMTGLTFSSMTSGVCQVLATIRRCASQSPVGLFRSNQIFAPVHAGSQPSAAVPIGSGPKRDCLKRYAK